MSGRQLRYFWDNCCIYEVQNVLAELNWTKTENISAQGLQTFVEFRGVHTFEAHLLPQIFPPYNILIYLSIWLGAVRQNTPHAQKCQLGHSCILITMSNYTVDQALRSSYCLQTEAKKRTETENSLHTRVNKMKHWKTSVDFSRGFYLSFQWHKLVLVGFVRAYQRGHRG